jgi:hypothetical protein
VVNPQFPFAMDLGFLAMHIKTECAPIELRGSYVYEIQQSISQRGVLYGITQLKEFF